MEKLHLPCGYVDTVHSSNIEFLKGDLQDIVTERESRFKRFFSAKRHRDELQAVIAQLETARMNYVVRQAVGYHHRIAALMYTRCS